MASTSKKITPRSASKGSSKRVAPESPLRQSKRAKAKSRKSYAESDTEKDEDVNLKHRKPKVSDDDESHVTASDYEDYSAEESVDQSEPDQTDSEEDTKIKQSIPQRPKTNDNIPLLAKKTNDQQDLWKDGAKLPPGTRVVIKKPKARDPGNTPYTDATIHPNTMLFLKDLAANNDRQWLKMHDPDFRASFQDFTTWIEKLSEKIIEADETIPELPAKDVFFRIYRDVRFSKDPTPYKTYFSAAWSRTGRKGPYAHYYVQVQPDGGSFVGGGFWQPESATLGKLRRDVDRKPHKIKAVLTNAGVRSAFLGGIKDDDTKAVKAFTNLASNKSSALKRHPKGYDHDHKEVELLRLRNFVLGRKIPDKDVLGPEGLDRIAELIRHMVPFITYLNSIAMPDEGSSDSSEDEGQAESEGASDSEEVAAE